MATVRSWPSRILFRAARIALWFGLSAELVLTPYRAAAQPKLEYEVKAAFLLNFTKFVAWPDGAFAGAASPFTICVLGNDPFGRTLDETASGETVGSRKLVVRRIDEAPAAQACQIVFFGSEGKKPPVSPGSLGSGVLTVGEGQSFTRDGGIIAFVIDNRRVRFDINRSAAERAALRLSSKLLSVARSVER
ncbi:MAG: YfiR family protein [Bryobacteraceae bacterium]